MPCVLTDSGARHPCAARLRGRRRRAAGTRASVSARHTACARGTSVGPGNSRRFVARTSRLPMIRSRSCPIRVTPATGFQARQTSFFSGTRRSRRNTPARTASPLARRARPRMFSPSSPVSRNSRLPEFFGDIEYATGGGIGRAFGLAGYTNLDSVRTVSGAQLSTDALPRTPDDPPNHPAQRRKASKRTATNFISPHPCRRAASNFASGNSISPTSST